MQDDHAENGETVDHSQVVGQLSLSRAQLTRGEILEELEHPSAGTGGLVGSNYLRLSSQSAQSVTAHSSHNATVVLCNVWFVVRSGLLQQY